MAQVDLKLHPDKTHIADTNRGSFEFLGYLFSKGRRMPRKKSINKLPEAIRSKTRRTNGRSLQIIIGDVNRTLRGWFEYFKHGSFKTTYGGLDGWIRRRILLKRHKHVATAD